MLYFTKPGGALLHGDCLEEMKRLPDNSVDMILCDLPYGTTACKWDTVIPFEPLWTEYKRVAKKNAAIVLTASQPFTSSLVMSNPSWFKYQWVWVKNRSTGHVHSKNRPMKRHEDICVFSEGNTLHEGQSADRMPYFPQDTILLPEGIFRRTRNDAGDDTTMSKRKSHKATIATHTGYPESLIEFAIEMNQERSHPTQKPVALFEYLIKTYTNEGAMVLDNCAGSGTTAIACENLNRRWCCIEKEQEYCDVILKRLGVGL